MQLSKLTFSLASLVLISALVFATTPVMAADDGPTATLGAKLTDTDDRMALKVEVTFSPAVVVAEVEAGDLKYTLLDGAGDPKSHPHAQCRSHKDSLLQIHS